MPDDKKTESVKVWLSEPLELALRRLADAEDRKLSDYIAIVLRRHAWGHGMKCPADVECPARGE